jgi:hypothetical protein
MAAAVAALVLAVAGCSGGNTARTPAAAPPAAAPSSAAPAAPIVTQPPGSPDAGSLSGPVGTRFTVSGADGNGNPASYTVVLSQVDQNAAATGGVPADLGDHLVAAEFTITGLTGTLTDDNANENATMYGSDNEAYTPTFTPVTDGTDFINSGYFALGAGQTEAGWVTFELPDSVSALLVQWQDLGSYTLAVWTIGS